MRRVRWLLPLLLLIVGALAGLLWRSSNRDSYGVYANASEVPRFEEVPLPFVHEYDGGRSLPFMASSALDVDGDGLPELYLGGGSRQRDGLFALRGGTFVDVSAGAGLDKGSDDASYGAASLDLDSDGDTDLLVARDSGLWLYRNEGGHFRGARATSPPTSGAPRSRGRPSSCAMTTGGPAASSTATRTGASGTTRRARG